MSTSKLQTPPVIGRDLGPAGRLVRILAGLLFLAAAILTAVSTRAAPAAIAVIAVTFAGATIFYTLVFLLLGEQRLARADPWLVALGVVTPLALLSLIPMMPVAVGVGGDLYLSISMLVQAVIGYGGCEIVGIPTLLLRRRYTVYCALNGADLAESWIRSRRVWISWTLAIGAFVVIMLVSALVEVVAGAAGFYGTYLLFLLLGFSLRRIRAHRPRRSDPEPRVSVSRR